MKVSLAERPRLAAIERTDGWRPLLRAYGLDLAISLGLILAGARLWGLFQPSPPQSMWLVELHNAVARFTPLGLWSIYRDQVVLGIIDLGRHPGSLALYNLLFGVRLLYTILISAFGTLAVVWQQADTPSDWAMLIGFGTVLVACMTVLLASHRPSLLRVALALTVGPVAAVALFWVVQQGAVDLLDGLPWYAAAAPWCLLCPIACTLYWVIFPGAEHGATVTCVRRIGRMRLPGRPQRPRRGIALATPRRR